MKNLRQVTVIGLGLLGGSIALAVTQAMAGVKVVGFAHRAATRRRARRLNVADVVCGGMPESVAHADIVILATPVCTFEAIFRQIAGVLRPGCIVTDVGSTKVLPHRWAAKYLPRSVLYVGSHPIAGSEQRGVEFARDDLLERALCIVTSDRHTNPHALAAMKRFWSALGCRVKMLTPAGHDLLFANVSHLPHITAAALLNANTSHDLESAGRGFIDTSRVASGPANIWADVLLTNSKNCIKGIDRLIEELRKLRAAIGVGDRRRIEELLEKARSKRNALMKYKARKKELLV